MPTPRYHGGAPLNYRPLNVPGFRGLNTQAAGSLLGPEWATRLENTVIDSQNRIASRKGFDIITTSTITGVNLTVLHEQYSTEYLYACGDDMKLYESQDVGGTWSDVTGTATVTDSNGMFVTFNDKVIYCQWNQKPAVMGASSFAQVVDANAPTTGIALSAFGRLWVVTSTKRSVKYCALLDETDWSTADSGLIDMTSVWQADDDITALASYNNSLLIMSNDNIVTYDDSTGSVLGIDPTQMVVRDITGGVGCVARDSVVSIEGDVWFLSKSGVMSFGRLTINRDNPLHNISQHVQDHLGSYVPDVDLSRVRAVYSPKERFYLLSLPAVVGGTGTEAAFCFDTRRPMQDGSYRCTGVWSLVPRSIIYTKNARVMMTVTSHEGEVGIYDGTSDEGVAYQMEYESGWSDFDSPYIKILKRLTYQVYIGGTNTEATAKWAFDFENSFHSQTLEFEGGQESAEYGIGEWGEAEYAGTIYIQERNASGTKSGEHIKVGLSASINGASIGLQQISVYTKTGRLR